ncbi:DNA-directed RNA polymerase III subunit RPC8 isoform X2 [Arachis ipaensis]|uniref:DNA-directed RNA polymerase III subunit RPC8 isoform X2 n=2 Tax=Arachis ipaensis TaxID=130454 RepID=UPI000A2B6D55|nr:DNA-directed RNA polymerase III subunit RPC8 isoform X2 [Arachis ipaensis]
MVVECSNLIVGSLLLLRFMLYILSSLPVSMFYLSKIEHTLPLPAPQLSRPIREAIHTELEKLFLDKVIANLGLCVSVYDIKSIEGGFIYPGDGAPTYTVVFNLIMFRPFVGEIMTAKLLSSDADGLRLSLGFFDDIYVPLQHLPSPNEFKAESKNSTKGTWYWKYEEQSYPVDDSDMIKFRIQNVTYPSIPVEQPKESKPFAPMLVTIFEKVTYGSIYFVGINRS